MKKMLFAALAFAAIVTSCSKDEVVSENPSLNQAIEFGTYTGKAVESRGLETTNNNFTQFAVTAYYTGIDAWKEDIALKPNFMYNQVVSRTTTNADWTYSPIKYWPTVTTDKISFFAHSPKDNTYAALSKNTATGAPTVTVTIPAETNDMVDFIADAIIDETHGVKTNDADNTVRPAVTFTMKHEMTRLALTAQLDENLEKESTVVITSIDFGKSTGFFYNKGVYSFPQNNQAEQGTWKFNENDNVALNLNNYLDFTVNKEYSGKTYEAATLGLTTATPVNLIKGGDSQYLFLLPPNSITGLSEAKEVTIKYDIVTKDEKLDAGYSCTSETKVVKFPATLLGQGKAYKVNLKFFVDKIELSATVKDWEETSNEVVVPYSPDKAK